jgi:hypothetical protein
MRAYGSVGRYVTLGVRQELGSEDQDSESRIPEVNLLRSMIARSDDTRIDNAVP